MARDPLAHIRLDKARQGDYITIVTTSQLTTVMKREWVLLVYKIPSHPTRLRAQVWRQLQRCGAMYLQNSVSIVPATSELAENMRWIADEIRDMGGESYVFRATTTSPGEEGEIERLFGSASRAQARNLREALSTVERRVRRTAGSRRGAPGRSRSPPSRARARRSGCCARPASPR